MTIRVEVDGKVFDALLNVAEVPEDREMREELEAIGSEGKCAVLLKVTLSSRSTVLLLLVFSVLIGFLRQPCDVA